MKGLLPRTLAGRIALVTLLGVVVAVAVAALLTNRLVRESTLGSARTQLSRLADTAETRADTGDQRAALRRVRRVLRSLDVELGVVTAAGRVIGGPEVSGVLTDTDLTRLGAGKDVSTERDAAGTTVLVEARPTARGAIVLVERRSQALASGERSVRAVLLALLAGVLVALVASVVLARALARPLRRTAGAAHALAAGDREVEVRVEGPVEVAEVAASLNTLAAALTRSEAQQRAFLMSVSHDLRTPLTTIRGYAESMAEGAVSGDLREVGTTLTGEALRLQRLIDDLLDLARLRAERFRVEPTQVLIADVVTASARVWTERCRRAGVEFGVEDRLPGIVEVHTDPARIRQVLDGLLENAIRVTPSGRPVVLCCSSEPGSVLLEVRDGGPGLTAEDLADAFRPGVLYERYRGVRPSGTGLGLAIAAGLVERLGGHIEAGHAPEGGARFTVRLPRD